MDSIFEGSFAGLDRKHDRDIDPQILKRKGIEVGSKEHDKLIAERKFQREFNERTEKFHREFESRNSKPDIEIPPLN